MKSGIKSMFSEGSWHDSILQPRLRTTVLMHARDHLASKHKCSFLSQLIFNSQPGFLLQNPSRRHHQHNEHTLTFSALLGSMTNQFLETGIGQ